MFEYIPFAYADTSLTKSKVPGREL
jgi:hypothetical protein